MNFKHSGVICFQLANALHNELLLEHGKLQNKVTQVSGAIQSVDIMDTNFRKKHLENIKILNPLHLA